MDSFEPRMNPRFLGESEKGLLWEPRVIESGRETAECFKEDEKGKRRASLLSSFSLSWFTVIHVSMSSVHALSSLVRLVTSLRGADFWSCVSSAKSWWFTQWLDPTKEERKCCHCPERREYRLQYVTKRSQCCVLLDRLTERDCWGCFLGDGRAVCGGERLF